MDIVEPFALKPKQIFQEECRRVDKGWDDPIVDSSKLSWAKWLLELPQLQDILLNRCLVRDGFGEVASVEIPHYSDASQNSYGVDRVLLEVEVCRRGYILLFPVGQVQAGSNKVREDS